MWKCSELRKCGEDAVVPTVAGAVSGPGEVAVGRWQFAIGVVTVVQGEAHLLEVVHRLNTGGRFADLLNSRNEQPDEDRDDGDHDEKFDQREAA